MAAAPPTSSATTSPASPRLGIQGRHRQNPALAGRHRGHWKPRRRARRRPHPLLHRLHRTVLLQRPDPHLRRHPQPGRELHHPLRRRPSPPTPPRNPTSRRPTSPSSTSPGPTATPSAGTAGRSSTPTKPARPPARHSSPSSTGSPTRPGLRCHPWLRPPAPRIQATRPHHARPGNRPERNPPAGAETRRAQGTGGHLVTSGAAWQDAGRAGAAAARVAVAATGLMPRPSRELTEDVAW